jgi:hypothetical protein
LLVRCLAVERPLNVLHQTKPKHVRHDSRT